MVFEHADISFLPHIDAIRAACVALMRASGIDQWDDIYPSADVFLRDCNEQNLWVLKDEEKTLVGCATLDERQSPEYAQIDWLYRRQRIGVVHRLMIPPSHRGKGHGKALMRHVEREACSRRYEAIRLDAFVHNPPAIALYSALSYRRAGEVNFRKGRFVCFEKLLESIA